METPVLIGNATLYLGDCIEVMKTMPENSLDAIICDPPYLISFMNTRFDSQHKSLPGANEGQKMQEWHRRWVTEAYRILKPGGHLAAFGGDRTHHRLMSAMEDVGFELRFNCYWIFSSGFPKSQNASLALDRYFGETTDKIDRFRIDMKATGKNGATFNSCDVSKKYGESTNPISKQWTGYGTALKPAVEIACVGRKPMIGTLAENLLEWGCGAMNLDACRVAIDESVDDPRLGGKGSWKTDNAAKNVYEGGYAGDEVSSSPLGRFPPHLLLDGSEVVKKCFPETGPSPKTYVRNASGYGWDGTIGEPAGKESLNYGDKGSASRFFPSLPYDEEDCATLFYCGKASKEDRNQGCSGVIKTTTPSEKTGRSEGSVGLEGDKNNRGQTANPYANGGSVTYNNHVSVKPTALMRWICRLLTPKGGTLLDPFMGSGSTLKAASLEGFKCIGIEMDPDYFEIAKARVIDANKQPSLDLFSEAA